MIQRQRKILGTTTGTSFSVKKYERLAITIQADH